MPELVRYMHVNSLRGWVVEELKELVGCPEATHSGIIGRTNRSRQVVHWVLAQFGRRVAEERGLVCFWAVQYLGMSGTALAQITELAELGVRMSAWRGEAPARDRGFELIARQQRINE